MEKVFFAVITAALTGCYSSTISVPDPVELTGARTWYGAVAPLVTARCAICHRADDIGPFPLETIDDVQPRLPMIKAAVAAKRMPPFPPEQSDASGCPKVSDVRQMSEAERAFLLAWIDDGAPLGDKRDLPKSKPNKPLGDPTDRWPMPQKYLSKVKSGDDYRCFLIRPTLLTAIPVAAVSVAPGTRSVVHHSAVYLIPPDQIAAIQKMDDAEEGPGYSCFGGVGVTSAYPTGLWVPGNDAPLVPPHDGVGYYLPVGWAFVVQQHYNFTGAPVADQSDVVLWRAPGLVTEYPHFIVAGDVTFTLPPMSKKEVVADADVLGKGTVPALNLGAEGRVYGVWGHMHLLGRTLEMDIVRKDGTQQCLLHINNWSFHWQSLYKLKDPVAMKPGDKLRVKCTYENTTSATVRYGEGTADEMCLASVAMLDP